MTLVDIDVESRGGIESITVENGVEITAYKDGSMTFRALGERTSDKNRNDNCENDEKRGKGKKRGFFKRHRVRPYAKMRNLSDPFGKSQEGGGKIGYEFGIRFDF